MSTLPPHRYIAQGVQAGHNEDVLRRAAAQTASMRSRGIQPVLSLGHLAHLTGVDYGMLRAIVERENDPYVDIVRPKRSGGVRRLSSPLPALMGAQRWVLDHVLAKIPNHPDSFAYQRHRSITGCASRHIGASWMLKADLHDFFPSIGEKSVYRQFRSLGYGALISFELARICTRATLPRTVPESFRYQSIPAYRSQKVGTLPQGAPTSGALANAVATGLDKELSRFAIDKGLTYTRYSDDLVFSASERFDRKLARRLIPEIREIIRDQDFVLHERKTRLVPPGSRFVVLGLIVDEERIRLPKEYKRRIQTHVRGVESFGLRQHATHRKFDSLIGFVNHVDGSIAHAISVEQDYGRALQQRWNRVLDNAGYSSIPGIAGSSQ